MSNYTAVNDYRNYLMHYGVLGMKWGVRRYQNPDGTLTAAGMKRYGRKLVKQIVKEVKSQKIKSHRDYKPSDKVMKKISSVINDNTKNDLKNIYHRRNQIQDRLANLYKSTIFEDSNEHKQFEKDVHDRTIKDLKELSPKSYNDMVNQMKRDKSLDFYDFHDFRKLYEGTYDMLGDLRDKYEKQFYQNNKTGREIEKLEKEWDKLYVTGSAIGEKVAKDILGDYGNYKIGDTKNIYNQKTINEFLSENMQFILPEYLDR